MSEMEEESRGWSEWSALYATSEAVSPASMRSTWDELAGTASEA